MDLVGLETIEPAKTGDLSVDTYFQAKEYVEQFLKNFIVRL